MKNCNSFVISIVSGNESGEAISNFIRRCSFLFRTNEKSEIRVRFHLTMNEVVHASV